MNHGPDRTNNTSLRNMDTEALRSLLMMELSAEGDLNIEKIQEITDIIAEREQLDVPDVDASWKDFQNQYRSTEPLHTLDQEQPVPPTRKSKHKALRRVFLVAAVLASLLLGATLTAQAADYDLWGAVAQWTSETFGFTLQQSDEKLDTISPELQPLWDAIQDAGISDPLLPTYLPEEYQQVELSRYRASLFLRHIPTNGWKRYSANSRARKKQWMVFTSEGCRCTRVLYME